MNVRGINHIVLKVRSLEESDRFYREIVGLELLTRRGRMAFYSAGAHTHDLALLEIGDVPQPLTCSTGLYHFCFDVESEEHLRQLHRRLRSFGVAVSGGVDHNIMHSFYVADPDGNTVEFGVDVPQEKWRGGQVWAGDREYQIM